MVSNFHAGEWASHLHAFCTESFQTRNEMQVEGIGAIFHGNESTKKKGKCLETENKKALSEAQKVDPLLLLLPFLFFLIQERETDFGESKKGLLPFSLSPFYRRGL